MGPRFHHPSCPSSPEALLSPMGPGFPREPSSSAQGTRDAVFKAQLENLSPYEQGKESLSAGLLVAEQEHRSKENEFCLVLVQQCRMHTV